MSIGEEFKSPNRKVIFYIIYLYKYKRVDFLSCVMCEKGVMEEVSYYQGLLMRYQHVSLRLFCKLIQTPYINDVI